MSTSSPVAETAISANVSAATSDLPAPGTGIVVVKSVSLGKGPLILDQRTKLETTVTSPNGANNGVLIYFAGDPRKGGKPLGLQPIAHIGAGSTYDARIFFQPSSCAPVDVYVVGATGPTQFTIGNASAKVIVEPVGQIHGMSTYISDLDLRSSEVSDRLKGILADAANQFSKGDYEKGKRTLRDFEDYVRSREGKELKKATAEELISQVKRITGCLHDEGKQDTQAALAAIPVTPEN